MLVEWGRCGRAEGREVAGGGGEEQWEDCNGGYCNGGPTYTDLGARSERWAKRPYRAVYPEYATEVLKLKGKEIMT